MRPDERTFKKGATLNRGGTLTYPTSDWTGHLELFDTRPGRSTTPSDFGITVHLIAIGPNPQKPDHTDYSVLFTAPASVTAAWPVEGPNGEMPLVGDLMLTDSAGNVAASARRFDIKVRA